MVTQAAATIADLRVGDQVQIQGVPTGITASSITAGQMPTFLPGGGPGGGGGGNAGGGPAAGNPGGRGAGAGPTFASASGRVTSTNPLTISLGEGVSLTVTPAANARITRITPVAFNNLKAGDRVMAMGQAGQDGTFTATGLTVNMEMGPGGFGGFGPGGFGGRGGRGGGRRGGQGGPQGAPGDPNI
jgi:hypothetical protein